MAENSTKLVEMLGIDKRFPGVHALKSVQFDLEAGEVLVEDRALFG